FRYAQPTQRKHDTSRRSPRSELNHSCITNTDGTSAKQYFIYGFGQIYRDMKSTFIASVTGIMSHGTEYQRAHDGHLLFAIFPHQYPKGQALYSTLLISFPEAAGR
ncbi:TPA: hypothetical protein ACNU26_003099, partial [Aeromonas salmonicida]